MSESAAGATGASTGGGWIRHAGVAGAAVGLLAAGVAVERLTVNHTVRRRARTELDTAGPYGSLRGEPGTAVAADGTELHYEVDDPVEMPDPPETSDPGGLDPQVAAAARRAGCTVVFSHGYCLNQDVWHFQRAALRGVVRTVFWDQRSHGRSARARPGEQVSIDRLGGDLKAVLDAAAPEGPVLLVGHSMGGMTMMALAEQYPEYVARRVCGAAFLGTSAGGLGEVTYGLPATGTRAVRRVVPGLLNALAGQAELVERSRRATAELFAVLVRRYSFGRPRDVDSGVSRFAQRLIESVPVDVIADFYPAFTEHEKRAALGAFDGKPALVLAGDRDQITPYAHSEVIAAELPEAELSTVVRAGHLMMLECPELVDAELAALLARTIRKHGEAAESTAPAESGRERADRTHHHPDP